MLYWERPKTVGQGSAPYRIPGELSKAEGRKILESLERAENQIRSGQSLVLKLIWKCSDSRGSPFPSFSFSFPVSFLQDPKTSYSKYLNIPSFVWCSFYREQKGEMATWILKGKMNMSLMHEPFCSNRLENKVISKNGVKLVRNAAEGTLWAFTEEGRTKLRFVEFGF